MANPNPEIWGAPETWINAKHFNFIGEGNPDTRTSKPKTADFGNISGTLAQGDLVGKTPINTPIDGSICPCGQDPAVSCFGSIALFKNKQDASENVIPDNIITSTIPCNWFMYDGTGISGDTYGHKRNWNDTNSIWYPDATTAGNWNLYVTPFTYWQLNSVLISVEVATFYDYGWGPSIHWEPLANWKNTYSDRKICDIRLIVRGVSQQTDTTITYQTNTTMADGDMFGFANMDYFGSLIDYAAYCTNSRLGSIFRVLGINDYGNYYDTDRTVILNGYNMFDGQEVKTRSAVDTDRGWLLWYEIPYSDDTYEKIMKMTACFGCVFTNTNRLTIKKDMTDEDIYIPVIDGDGVCHGEYTHGSGNINNDLYTADSIRDKDYDPDKPFDPNIYSNITSFNSISGGASMTLRYVLDKANVDTLSDDLWTISSELATVQGNIDYTHFSEKIIDNFLVTSPIDCIVSIKRFPFDVPHTFSSTKELVKLGKNTATAQGYSTYDVFNTVQFRGVNINKRFGGCFLDYEPFTQYEVYVPFCGTTNLQAADIVGHTLNIRLQIDLLTGTCTAYIMADSLVIETLTGNCACDLQITGTDTTYMNSAIVNSITNARNAKTQKEVADLSTISPAGLFSAAANPWKASGEKTTAATNLYQADYNLQHIQTPLHSMGTASALTGWYQEFNARLMIYYPEGDAIISTVPPKLADLTNYGHTTGFATVQNKTLNNFSGLTVCSDVDLSGITQATATEKEMLYNALTSGVYI